MTTTLVGTPDPLTPARRTRTALITGATAGIGAAFARHLAADGYALVLVARNATRLAASVVPLTAAGAPEVEVIVADLTLPADRAVVAGRLADRSRPVDILVNNAGLGLGKDFADATLEELQYQLDLNVTAVMELSHAAVGPMVERRHGGIINVASIAGLVPGRGSTYSASKAWVVSFSEGLAMSLAGSGVRIQALCPGFVRTEFHERANIDMDSTPSRLYVDINLLIRTSLADLARNHIVSVPGRLYSTLAVIARLAPRAQVRSIASKLKSKGRT